RRHPAGKIPGHSGISLRPLCRPGDPGAAVPSRGPAAARLARLFSGAPPRDGAMSPLVACRALTCRFAGEVALHRVDVSAREGGIVVRIGPNGSVNTTLFNAITGISRPQDGSVTSAGADVTGARPQAIYRAGITRTFQRWRMCLPLSVFDNIMV